MKTISRYIMTLVALLAVTTGAWATTPNSIVINGTPLIGDKSISLTYYFDPANFEPSLEPFAPTLKVKCAADNKWDEILLSLTEVSSGTTDITLENLGEFEAGKTYEVCFAYNNGSWVDEVFQSFVPAAASSASSGPEVAWDKAKKTGTFTMPGGNVTLEPEYYPQAALTAAPTAINDVPATTDGAIVNAGTVANIGSTETAQGTVMYYVSQTALDDAALLALAADQWTADVPTAESLAQGQAYVYYYVRGNDSDNDEENFSDGDILAANALTVTIAAEPTYAVTFAEGVNPEPPAEPEWTASPDADVKKGTEVTVTYTGSKKVIGVKAEKKAAAAAAEGHALSASAVGEIVGSDGKAYAVADNDNLPSGVTAVAMVAYKSGSNGLAIQLNGSPVEKEWDEAKTYAEGLSAVTGGTWRLPSKDDWQNMFVGCAVSGDATSASDEMNPIAGFKAKIAATGITWKSFYYWSSTEHVMGAWSVLVKLDDSNAAAYFDFHSTSGECTVLGCLAF